MELRAGRIVQLGEFGNFRLSLSSNGASDKKSFSQADVKGARVIFTPGASCVIPKAGRLHLYRKKEDEGSGSERGGGGGSDRPEIE